MTATQVSDGAAPKLRERRAELRSIEAALAAARGDEGQLLLLSGPAGVGKTALLRAATAAATKSGFLVLGARGGELEQSFPFGVVGQLFAPIVHDAKEQGSEEDLLAGDARLAELALSPAPGHLRATRTSRCSTPCTGCAGTCASARPCCSSSTTLTGPTPRPCGSSPSWLVVAMAWLWRSRSPRARASRESAWIPSPSLDSRTECGGSSRAC